jgi:hypothetical protein
MNALITISNNFAYISRTLGIPTEMSGQLGEAYGERGAPNALNDNNHRPGIAA